MKNHKGDLKMTTKEGSEDKRLACNIVKEKLEKRKKEKKEKLVSRDEVSAESQEDW